MNLFLVSFILPSLFPSLLSCDISTTGHVGKKTANETSIWVDGSGPPYRLIFALALQSTTQWIWFISDKCSHIFIPHCLLWCLCPASCQAPHIVGICCRLILSPCELLVQVLPIHNLLLRVCAKLCVLNGGAGPWGACLALFFTPKRPWICSSIFTHILYPCFEALLKDVTLEVNPPYISFKLVLPPCLLLQSFNFQKLMRMWKHFIAKCKCEFKIFHFWISNKVWPFFAVGAEVCQICERKWTCLFAFFCYIIHSKNPQIFKALSLFQIALNYKIENKKTPAIWLPFPLLSEIFFTNFLFKSSIYWLKEIGHIVSSVLIAGEKIVNETGRLLY